MGEKRIVGVVEPAGCARREFGQGVEFVVESSARKREMLVNMSK